MSRILDLEARMTRIEEESKEIRRQHSYLFGETSGFYAAVREVSRRVDDLKGNGFIGKFRKITGRWRKSTAQQEKS